MDLSCPHCGLKLGMSGPRHEYCPRCLTERRQPVPLVASSLFKLGRSEDDSQRSRAGEARSARPAVGAT